MLLDVLLADVADVCEVADVSEVDDLELVLAAEDADVALVAEVADVAEVAEVASVPVPRMSRRASTLTSCAALAEWTRTKASRHERSNDLDPFIRYAKWLQGQRNILS